MRPSRTGCLLLLKTDSRQLCARLSTQYKVLECDRRQKAASRPERELALVCQPERIHSISSGISRRFVRGRRRLVSIEMRLEFTL